MRTSEAEATAVALMTAAYVQDDICALLATRLAFAPVDDRVLVSFCLVEACWSWAPPTTTSDHPVLGPTLRALHSGDHETVRSALVRAMTGKTAGSCAALLVQLAYATVRLVPDIDDRLKSRGLAVATDPEAAANRPAGQPMST
ncbi:hypothetical protein GCM10023339_27780 [Alloalcanivorax gelatiniphagus]